MSMEDPVPRFIALAYFLKLSVFSTQHGCFLLRKWHFLVQGNEKWGLGQKKKKEQILKIYVSEFFWVMTPCSFTEDRQLLGEKNAFI